MRMIRASAVLRNRLVGNRKDPHLAIATHSGIDLNFSNFRPLRVIRHSIADFVIDFSTNAAFQMGSGGSRPIGEEPMPLRRNSA
jgi:hypothetical protein